MKNVIPCFCVSFRKLTLRRISQSLGHRPPTTLNPMMDMEKIKSRLMHGFRIFFFLRHTTHTHTHKEKNKTKDGRDALHWTENDLVSLMKCIYGISYFWKNVFLNFTAAMEAAARELGRGPEWLTPPSFIIRAVQVQTVQPSSAGKSRHAKTCDEIIRERRRAGQESWEQKTNRRRVVQTVCDGWFMFEKNILIFLNICIS